MLRKLKWQIPWEPLAARYNWCQGQVPGRGPAVEKHCCRGLDRPCGSKGVRFPDFKTISIWRLQGCQPYEPAAFTPSKYSWYSCLLSGLVELRAILRPEGLRQRKIPMTPHVMEIVQTKWRELQKPWVRPTVCVPRPATGTYHMRKHIVPTLPGRST